MKKNELLRLVRNPPDDFRGLPFWSWNGKLEEKELRRQVGVFHEMGYGGFFMHPRTGMDTEYLSDEFFHAVNVCIDEAKKKGLKAWFYDEDRYASGSAGGMTANRKAFRRCFMKVDVLDHPVFRKRDFSWFAGRLSGTKLFSPRRMRKDEKLRPGEVFLRFHVDISQPNSWNNNGCSADNMNASGMHRFIEITHGRYAARCHDDFGKTSPGFFSDEPNCSNWTDGMEKKFFVRYGVDLAERIPELFFEIDGEECSLLRWQFHNLRIELLCEAFARPVANWCHTHNLLFTGHVLGEDSVLDQTRTCPSSMRFIEYMDIPGVDSLGELFLNYDAILQTSSVAHQKGTGKVLCETFAGCGWDFSLEAQKATADWQAALGITVFCLHLAFYTMEGCAKRDYPPSFSFQSPYFHAEKILQDYFARIGGLRDTGMPVRKILVVHPLESTWFWKNPESLTKIERKEESERLPKLRNALLSAHLAFDYGDEGIIARLGFVTEKQLFFVGKAAYELVVLPEMRTVRKTTLDLLEKFADSDGKVLFVGRPPEYVDGVKSDHAEKLYRMKFQASSLPSLASDIEKGIGRTISIFCGVEGMQITPVLASENRFGKNAGILFLCNTGMNLPDFVEMGAPHTVDRTLVFPDARIRWRMHQKCRIYEIEPKEGKIFSVESAFLDGYHEFSSSFDRLETHLYLAFPGKLSVSERTVFPEIVRETPIESGRVYVVPDEPNVMVLDFPSLSIDGGEFSPVEYVLDADSRIRDFLKIPHRTHFMIQPWARRYAKNNYMKSVPVRLRYSFECDAVPEKLILALEHPESFEKIMLNGENISKRDEGWWCDTSIRKIVLRTQALHSGKNVLELKCEYSGFLCGFESMFLLGDFSVRNDRICTPVRELVLGDWCFQGFPYYSGNMTYYFSLEWQKDSRVCFLCFPTWKGSCLGVSVNGSEIEYLTHAPYRVSMEKKLKRGKNDFAVTVFGSRRNSHGPFFETPDRGGVIGPKNYETVRFNIRLTSSCGLLESPKFIWV